MSAYTDWIAANVSGTGYGKCDETTAAMVTAFPELRRARGFYHCPIWGRRTHWWCVDPQGTVVDPTAAQFPSGGVFEYEEVPDEELADRVPSGPCHDCGGPCYRGATFCSDACAESTRRYLGIPKERWDVHV